MFKLGYLHDFNLRHVEIDCICKTHVLVRTIFHRLCNIFLISASYFVENTINVIHAHLFKKVYFTFFVAFCVYL
jgi:hypothetical protein